MIAFDASQDICNTLKNTFFWGEKSLKTKLFPSPLIQIFLFIFFFSKSELPLSGNKFF